MLISYFLALLIIWNISNVQMVKLKNEKHQSDEIKKLIDCKICQEMFQYEFNYEKLLKDDSKISLIKSFFGEISEKDFSLRDYFSKDNLDFISKEISMQYFFKGEDSLFSSDEHLEKFKNCKSLKTSDTTESANSDYNNFSHKNNQCDVMKLKICENVLSFEADVCVGFHNKLMLLKSKWKGGILNNNHNKDMSAFSGGTGGSGLDLKSKLEKERSSGNAVLKNINKAKEQGKNSIDNTDGVNRDAILENKFKDSIASDNTSSSFITKENIIENFELLNKKPSFDKDTGTNKKNDNYNSDANIEDSFKKYMDLKARKEQDENRLKNLNDLNYRSKQINKFISLGFNGIKQDTMITQENEAFAEKSLKKLLMQQNNILNSNLII